MFLEYIRTAQRFRGMKEFRFRIFVTANLRALIERYSLFTSFRGIQGFDTGHVGI